MSATGKVKSVLDRLGVIYTEHGGTSVDSTGKYHEFFVFDAYKMPIARIETSDDDCDVILQFRCAPISENGAEIAQGRGECHNAETREGYFACSGCGYTFSSWGGFGCDCGDEPDFRYCPHCGRRVAG